MTKFSLGKIFRRKIFAHDAPGRKRRKFFPVDGYTVFCYLAKQHTIIQHHSPNIDTRVPKTRIACYFHNIRGGGLRILKWQNIKIARYFHIRGEIAKQHAIHGLDRVLRNSIEQHGKIINSRDNKQRGFTIEIYGEIA